MGEVVTLEATVTRDSILPLKFLQLMILSGRMKVEQATELKMLFSQLPVGG